MRIGVARCLAASSAFALSAFALLALASCAMPPTTACPTGLRAAIGDTLFFGTERRTGNVTAGEWAGFLKTTVTPRFPDGLTVFDASGQWRDAGGKIVGEATHVLLLVHPDDATNERRVDEIVAAYRTRFDQEAVLRTRTGTCVSP